MIKAIQDLEAKAPDALIVVNGDFNHGSMKHPGLRFYQHVNCPTRGESTLDLCYTNVKDAYVSSQLTKLGEADHDLVLLLPKYRPVVQREKPRVITIKQWSDDALDQLQDCFDRTDWEMFVDTADDIHELTDTVSSYIKFCEDAIIPTKKVKCYPNNKPWITKRVKQLINKKKLIFRTGSKNDLKLIQKEINSVIKQEKDAYKRKIENNFTTNNIRDVWTGMRLMSGYTNGSSKHCSLPEYSQTYANQLNSFYNRFDCHDFTDEIERILRVTSGESAPFLTITEDDVLRDFSRLNASKSAGPDKLSPRVLKLCNHQLSYIFTHIFNLCFRTQCIPRLWKQSCIIPVPKKSTITSMNDLRPVALTSVAMKSCERFILQYIKRLTVNLMDDHQFAYRKGRNTDDALLFTLDTLYSHLEDSKSGKVSARIMFFDFSSAFNTMQPHILANVLLGSDDVPHALVRWVLDYLTIRSQFVRIGRDVVSDIMECSTGAPQGTVLAPFLFTLYTSGIRSTDLSCPLIKFADDTALVGRIKNDDDRIYREQIANFVAECDRNYLHLNVSKTKELIIDFRRANKIVPEPVVIDSKTVDRVTEYKYLGVVMDDQLKWDAHVEYVAKRLKPRMYCLRKLVSFDVNQNILSIFYNSIISSVWSYCITSWVGNINKTSKKVLDDTVKRAGRAVGKRLPMVDEVFDSRVDDKLHSVLKDIDHPLHAPLNNCIIPRSGRMRPPKAHTNRYPSSFMGQAVRIFNASFNR